MLTDHPNLEKKHNTFDYSKAHDWKYFQLLLLLLLIQIAGGQTITYKPAIVFTRG